jgi:hypothetical protein
MDKRLAVLTLGSRPVEVTVIVPPKQPNARGKKARKARANDNERTQRQG